jgi:hypothetical protein
LYLGICYLKVEKADSAIACFNLISPSSSFSQDAGWYKGLSYLKTGDTQKATSIFRDIIKLEKHFKKKQAEDILHYLNEMK